MTLSKKPIPKQGLAFIFGTDSSDHSQHKTSTTSPLPDVDRLQSHGTEAFNLAVDVVIAAGEFDVFYLGTRLDGLGRTFNRKVFYNDDRITILQHIAVRIFYDGCVGLFSSNFGDLIRVPLVATL